MSNHGVNYRDFNISVGDDDFHEEITAEISYKGNFIALLSQEEGFDNLQIEFYSSDDTIVFSCKAEDLLKALAVAKNRLWELRRIN